MARRTKAEAEQTRRKILNAALDLFVAKGYERATFEDVAKRIHMTKGAVYWHFKSKPELLADLVARLTASHNGQIARALPNPRSLDKVVAHLVERARVVSSTSAYRKFFRMMMGLWWAEKKPAAIRTCLCQMEDDFFSDIEKTLLELQKKGEIRDDADIASGAKVLGSLWLGFMALQINSGRESDLSVIMSFGFKTVLDTCLAQRF